MISKELLSEVLGVDRNDIISDIYISNNMVIFDKRVDECEFEELGYTKVNVHELAHKCKEWAWNNGYRLKDYRTNEQRIICRVYDNQTYKQLNFVVETTYMEAIFKACEWIRTQNDNI